MGAPAAPPLEIGDAEVLALRAIVSDGTGEQRVVTRARIVLLSAEGVANTRIAKQVGVSLPTVLLWRARFAEHGVDGLADAPHPGRPRVYGRGVRDKIVTETLTPSDGVVTHWSRARLADRIGVSASTVGRVWREANFKPHRSKTVKYSNDSLLVAKVTDIVGLYLNPPERAIALSVFDATQAQALDRTQPMLPLCPGVPERRSHDFQKHVTVNLFAALGIATGKLTHSTCDRHTGADFRAFLKCLARACPKGELHLILDNVSSHETPAVVTWLGRHKRFAFHRTSTSASWMNQAGTLFGILSCQAGRRSSFHGVEDLTHTVDEFTRAWTDRAAPFAWVKTADQILTATTQNPKTNSGAEH